MKHFVNTYYIFFLIKKQHITVYFLLPESLERAEYKHGDKNPSAELEIP